MARTNQHRQGCWKGKSFDDRAFVLLAVLFSLALLAIAMVQASRSRAAWDARVFLEAGRRFIEGTELYRESDGHLPFKYAPPIALLFAPYAIVASRLGLIAWNVTGVALFVLATRSWIRWLKPLRATELLVAGASLASSLYLEVHFGQCDFLIFWLATFCFACAREDRPWLAGASLAGLVLIKPPTLMIGVAAIWFAKRRSILALSAAGSLLALAGMVALRYGFGRAFGQFVAWHDTLARTTPPWLLGHNTQSWPALVHDLLRLPAPTKMGEFAVAQLVATAACGLVLLAIRRDPLRLMAGCMLASATLSPLAWRANFVLALPAVLLLLQSAPSLSLVGFGANLSVQLLLADGVLTAEHTQAVLMRRPYAWLSLLALIGMTLGSSSAKTHLGEKTPSNNRALGEGA